MVITNQEEEGEGRGARAKKAEIIISVKTVLEARAKNGRFWAGAGRAVGRLSLLEIYEEVKIWKIIVFHSRDKRSEGARATVRSSLRLS